MENSDQQRMTIPLPELGEQWSFWVPAGYRYMVYWLEVLQPIKQTLFIQVMRYLILFHDALRLHALKEGIHYFPYIHSAIEDDAVQWVSLAQFSEHERPVIIKQTIDKIYQALDNYEGQLSRFVYFDNGADIPGLFLSIFHHGLFDVFSSSVLTHDFQVVYAQLLQGQEVLLPSKTASVAQFVARVRHYLDHEYPQELNYWRACVARVKPWPVDYPEQKLVEAQGTVLKPPQPRTVTMALSEAETVNMFRSLPAVNIPVLYVFLTAIVQTWVQWTSEPLFIHLFDSGRTLFPDLDLSRSVGNFSSGRYILLETKTQESPLETLRTVVRQIKNVPFKGAGPSLADYAPEKEKEIDVSTYPVLRVNYFGNARMKTMQQGLPFLRNAQQYKDLTEHASVEKGYQEQEINGMVIDNHFTMSWSFDEQLYRLTTIERLTQSTLSFLSAITAEYADIGIRQKR